MAAIAQQAEAEPRAQAERAAARKSASKRGRGKIATKPAPPKRLPPPLQHVSAPAAKDAKPTTSAADKSLKPQQSIPVQTTAAMPSVKAVQSIQPTAAVSTVAKSAQVNAIPKLPLSQATF